MFNERYLRDFPHIGVLRKEQKTCLVNLASGKGAFCNPADREQLRQKLDFSSGPHLERLALHLENKLAFKNHSLMSSHD